jgi:alkylated DNA repair protein (DNA oxidative demethylase)
MAELAPGLIYLPAYFDRAQQQQLVETLRDIVKEAPLFTPQMPKTGKPFSVRMTNCGSLGWVSDRLGGYRYQAHHPLTGLAWPAIPERILTAWRDLAGYPNLPEACLVNYYAPNARMGLHQDRDELALDAPVLSVSLGDSALFRYGGTQRKDRTKSIRLHSGDVVLIGGASRLIFHGIERVLPGTSTLLADGGRINLTLRRVTLPN